MRVFVRLFIRWLVSFYYLVELSYPFMEVTYLASNITLLYIMTININKVRTSSRILKCKR